MIVQRLFQKIFIVSLLIFLLAGFANSSKGKGKDGKSKGKSGKSKDSGSSTSTTTCGCTYRVATLRSGRYFPLLL